MTVEKNTREQCTTRYNTIRVPIYKIVDICNIINYKLL
jgi:hypothetical protein